MKKLGIFVLFIAMAATLCACGCAKKDTTDNNTGTEIMPTETVTIPVPETNIPDGGVDNSNPANGSRGVERFNAPMSDMQ